MDSNSSKEELLSVGYGESVNIEVSAEIATGYLRFPPHGTRQQRAFTLSYGFFFGFRTIIRNKSGFRVKPRMI